MRFLFNLLVALYLLVAPSLAQDDLPVWQGLAVSQAVEAGTGVCFGTEMDETMACAREQCIAQSGLDQTDCQPDLWCAPHGYAADIFFQHTEGPHWHEFICGATSREQLDALIAVKCDADYLIECTPVRMWDRDSNELLGLGD